MDALQRVFSVPQYVRFEGTGKGWNGYEESRNITYLMKPVGKIAFGGAAMKGWCQVNLTGECMDCIAGDVAETLSQLVEDLQGQYKRVDIALTTKDGSVGLETVREAYNSGGFATGGRRPVMREVTSTNRTEGQTIYIGDRTQPKFVRAYEKGYQLAKDFSLRLHAHLGASFPVDSMMIEGVPAQDIFRVETELKPDPEMFPSDVLVNRDSYFAGCYPYLAKLVQANPDTFRLTAQRKAIYVLDGALMEMRRQWGDVLYSALIVHGGDYMEVMNKIVGTKHSRALLEAGLLDAVH